MDFTELNLYHDLQRGIDEAGFKTCMPVQEMVFAHSLSGEDIYAQSQTGTGKTAAFLISIMQRIMTDPALRTRKVLILAPTRELAVQIEAEAKKLGKFLPITAGAFYGGVSYGPQVDMLRADVQIIVGTPGRIIDLLQQGKMLFKDVGFLVIDEADRMFDMGFIDDIRKLLRYLPPAEQRQTYLFSATLGLRVKDLAWEYMRDPKQISIEPEKVTVELVTQELYHVGAHEKLPLLLGLLQREKPASCLVFCNQKFMVEELARRLKVNGFDCEFIMGDLPQAKRSEVIERLKAGKVPLLVATDVAARGLDVEALDMVINYDVPEDAESYVHRIGRTARAGKAGKAITLACEKFVYGLYAIEKYLGSKIPVMPFDNSLLLDDRSSGIRFSRDRGGEGRSRDSRQGVRGYGSGRGGSYAGGRPSPDRQSEQRRSAPRREEQRPPSGDERRQPPREGQHRPMGEGQRQGQGRQRQPTRQGGAQMPPQAGQRPAQRQETQQQKPDAAFARQGAPRGQGQHPAAQRTQTTPPPSQKPAVVEKKPGFLDKIKKLFKKG
jgi:ATP-dependent RNA helicase RhlB